MRRRLAMLGGIVLALTAYAFLPGHAQEVPANPPPNPAGTEAPAHPSPSGPVVRIVSPENDGMIESGAVLVSLSVENLPSVPAGCAPLRMVLDNQTPIDIDDSASPVGLPNLTEGGHLLRVYAIDGEGKMANAGAGEAFAVARFFVRRRDFQNVLVPGVPWLTVNSPADSTFFTEENDPKKGGIPQARVALDFAVRGENAEGCLIHYRLNHREATVPAGKKIVWNDLKAGRYNLMVELLSANGLPVPGIFNQTEQTFDVQTPVKALSLTPVPATADLPAGTAAPVKKKP